MTTSIPENEIYNPPVPKSHISSREEYDKVKTKMLLHFQNHI